jgi:hypothetical protein
MKMCRSEIKGRRSLDVGLEYVVVAMFIAEETRTAQSALSAVRELPHPPGSEFIHPQPIRAGNIDGMKSVG